MRKDQLIQNLRDFVEPEMAVPHGYKVLAEYFAWYFGQLSLPDYCNDPNWGMDGVIPQLLLEALEAFRSSEDPFVATARECFASIVGYDMPDLINFVDGGKRQRLIVDGLARIFQIVTGKERVAAAIVSLFDAQHLILRQQAYRFAANVYARGLGEMIPNLQPHEPVGVYGQTVLCYYPMPDHAYMGMFEFSRGGDADGSPRESVTLICRPGSIQGLNMSPQALDARLSAALDMIDEVITLWPGNARHAGVAVAARKTD